MRMSLFIGKGEVDYFWSLCPRSLSGSIRSRTFAWFPWFLGNIHMKLDSNKAMRFGGHWCRTFNNRFWPWTDLKSVSVLCRQEQNSAVTVIVTHLRKRKRRKWLKIRLINNRFPGWKSPCRQFDSVPGHHIYQRLTFLRGPFSFSMTGIMRDYPARALDHGLGSWHALDENWHSGFGYRALKVA
jgi:hypothetical protein